MPGNSAGSPPGPRRREGLTLFCHALTGDDLADHTRHVVWFGASEPLDLSIFRRGAAQTEAPR